MSTYTGPWCHTCDLPITEDVTMRTPEERVADDDPDGPTVVLIGCLRCLTFPTDDPEAPNA